MQDIVVYRHTQTIVDFEGVVSLVQSQMAFIGYQQNREEVISELQNASKDESRSVLFVEYSQDMHAIGFAYGNICSGLENQGDYLYLNELYISPNHRQHGYGSRLLEYVQEWSKKVGCVYVAMVTHPDNTQAQLLYAREGFELEKLVWVDKYL